MYELKTKLNDASVTEFLNSVDDEQKRTDCFRLVDLMSKVSKAEPKMWGSAIVGFGTYRYQYASGQQGDWMILGFSPRKANITLYFVGGQGLFDAEKEHLGKLKSGKGCLYIKKYEDIDEKVLTRMLKASLKKAKEISVK